MKTPKVDVSKIPEVMKLIEKAASVMEEKSGSDDPKVKQELEDLQNKLREIMGNKKLRITEFQRYWAYTGLETMARKALMLPPEKCDVTDDQIREIVLYTFGDDFFKSHDEADVDYWVDFLEINTGLEYLSDYIFYPDMMGMDNNATLEQIADRIIADKNNQKHDN